MKLLHLIHAGHENTRDMAADFVKMSTASLPAHSNPTHDRTTKVQHVQQQQLLPQTHCTALSRCSYFLAVDTVAKSYMHCNIMSVTGQVPLCNALTNNISLSIFQTLNFIMRIFELVTEISDLKNCSGEFVLDEREDLIKGRFDLSLEKLAVERVSLEPSGTTRGDNGCSTGGC